MLVITSIEKWLAKNKLVAERLMGKNNKNEPNEASDKSNTNIRTLRLAMKVDMNDTQQIGLVRALLSRLDIIWAELTPGKLEDIMKELKIRQLFVAKQNEAKKVATVSNDNKPTVIDNPKASQTIDQTASKNNVVVYRGNNGNLYHQSKDWELCQCKHTKLRHAANPGRPFCMERQCSCLYYFKAITPIVYTKVEEQKMPMMLNSESLGEPASEPAGEVPIDKTQSSD